MTGIDADGSKIDKPTLEVAETKRPSARKSLLRPAVDALAAGLLFVVVTSGIDCAPLSASPTPANFAATEHSATLAAKKAVGEPGPAPLIEIATTSSVNSPDAVYRKTSATAAWALLALAFSMLAALNLSVFRHLRKVYVVPKRRIQPPK